MSTEPALAALYFVPEAFSTAGPKLMGRNAAGESFLKGFARHSRSDRFAFFVETPGHAEAFQQAVLAAGRQRSPSFASVTRQTYAQLADVGLLHYPAPGLADFAWQRALFGPRAWSLTGITHTTASAEAMDGLCRLLSAPLQPWDAVICTSTAVRTNVDTLLDAEQDYLAERFGATRFPKPQFPVIPLGIDTESFAFDDRTRAAARAAIGADDTTLVVLFTGRLSFHAKAHPLAMYQALAAAARDLPAGQKVILVECGWHANTFITEAFADAARTACPGIAVRTLDGRQAKNRTVAWASADIFCSLSDNIQETFGLVPIEAMAAGLPCIVSDWNGYKDTVRDGIDGFRIPTLAPPPGSAPDIARAHALGADNYDMYCGETCMVIAVDIAAATDAFRALFSNGDLRRRMGMAGRQRARDIYDWARIIPVYEQLWQELAAIRRAATVANGPRHPWPARMEPFTAFANYPSRTVADDTRFQADADAPQRFQRFARLAAVNFVRRTEIDPRTAEAVLAAAGQGPVPAAHLARLIDAPQPLAYRALVRLAKLGLLQVA